MSGDFHFLAELNKAAREQDMNLHGHMGATCKDPTDDYVAACNRAQWAISRLHDLLDRRVHAPMTKAVLARANDEQVKELMSVWDRKDERMVVVKRIYETI